MKLISEDLESIWGPASIRKNLMNLSPRSSLELIWRDPSWKARQYDVVDKPLVQIDLHCWCWTVSKLDHGTV